MRFLSLHLVNLFSSSISSFISLTLFIQVMCVCARVHFHSSPTSLPLPLSLSLSLSPVHLLSKFSSSFAASISSFACTPRLFAPHPCALFWPRRVVSQPTWPDKQVVAGHSIHNSPYLTFAIEFVCVCCFVDDRVLIFSQIGRTNFDRRGVYLILLF